MALWPRTIKPIDATALIPRGALLSWSATGRGEARASMQAGYGWSEEYLFNSTDAAARQLLALVMAYWRNGTVLQIVHPLYKTPLGGGTGTVTVNGGSQTGASLVTAGWGGTNPVLRHGDLIRIPTYGVRVVTADVTHTAGAATIPIDPPIFVGNSPTNGIQIAYTGVEFDVRIAEPPAMPKLASVMAAGLKLNFVEADPK
jgi:hypothetical protein